MSIGDGITWVMCAAVGFLPCGCVSSTVVASNRQYAVANPPQRKAFYAEGLFWVFYARMVAALTYRMCYRTSADGLSWSDEVVVTSVAGQGYDFSVWFDGTNVHYAKGGATTFYYRRGLPVGDGTITWDHDEQLIDSGAEESWDYPSVATDSEGYPWITYTYNLTLPNVVKSSTNDGSWSTAAGFPFQLNDNDGVWATQPVPLTDGRVVALYAPYAAAPLDNQVRARRWDGAAWGAERTTASQVNYWTQFSGVDQGDSVHLVFLSTTPDILHVQYDYASDSFGAEEIILASADTFSSPSLSINRANNNLYCFWANAPDLNHIYFVERAGGVWGTVCDCKDESADTISDADAFGGTVSFYRDYGSYIAAVYMTGAATPWNVNICALTL